MEIGSIEEVPIREVWQKEDSHFTPWLSKNLHELEKVLGIPPITNVETEVDAGRYRCDISGNIGVQRIIIENLFESADHDHLGKCITYASMLKADYIVLVAESFRDEHLTAIDWLNEQFKNDSAKFFAVTISAVKIGDSKPAPLFRVLSEPDDYQKQIEEERSSTEITARMANRKKFWADFINAYGQIDSSWKGRTPSDDTWMNKGGGVSGAVFSASFRGTSPRETSPTVSVRIESSDFKRNLDLFAEIKKYKESIEKQWRSISKEDLTWRSPEDGNLTTKHRYREIEVRSEIKTDLKNPSEEDLKKCRDWLMENMKKIEEVFAPILHKLK